MDTGDLLTILGIFVSLSTAVAALVLSIAFDRRRRQERDEDLRADAARIAAPVLTNLYGYAINAVPASRESQEQRYDDWLRRMDREFGVVYSGLMTLETATPNGPIRVDLNEALELLPRLHDHVWQGIQFLRDRNEGVANEAWTAVVPLQQRLLGIHKGLVSQLQPDAQADER